MFELFQPWRSRRMSRKTLDEILARLEPIFLEMSRMGREEPRVHPIVQLRNDFQKGDQIWLTIEPPPHPEFSKGSIFFYLLRQGHVVRRYHVMTA